MYNTKFIEITPGLKDGDRVLLAPPFDTKEKDLGGAIIADGEALPAGATNQPAASRRRLPRGTATAPDRTRRRTRLRPGPSPAWATGAARFGGRAHARADAARAGTRGRTGERRSSAAAPPTARRC